MKIQKSHLVCFSSTQCTNISENPILWKLFYSEHTSIRTNICSQMQALAFNMNTFFATVSLKKKKGDKKKQEKNKEKK